MADNNIPPEGKKIVTRQLDDGSTETVIRDDPNYGGTDCWVATAYFGDPYHENVILLREARNALMKTCTFGKVTVAVNNLYYKIGKTSFGQWWKDGLSRTEAINLRKSTSYVVLTLLLKLEKAVNQRRS